MDIGIIKLTQDKISLVDWEDYEKVNEYKWCYTQNGRNGYAFSDTFGHLHRFIMGLTKGGGKQIDHINGDSLDNRRLNLRISTSSQNNQNKKRSEGTSKYCSVSWCKQINTELGAAKAYNTAAIEYFGEFAKINGV